MDEIYELLRGKFRFTKFTINSFTTLWDEEEFSIDIDIRTEKHGDKRLHFSEVKDLNIVSLYSLSHFSSIEIADCAYFQWERADYHVTISEDPISFYCKGIHIENL